MLLESCFRISLTIHSKPMINHISEYREVRIAHLDRETH